MILRESGEEQILEYAENIRTAGNTLIRDKNKSRNAVSFVWR